MGNHKSYRIKSLQDNKIADTVYTTDSEPIVKHAKYCYANYPTIVNNIPKEKNHYNNTPEDYALVDNKLAASQRSIGESSNLAQICLSYSYNTEILRGISAEQCYLNVCILSCIAQCSIDNCKRSFDIDIMSEIERIKIEMNIKQNKLPMFQKTVKERNELRRLSGAKRLAKIQQRNEENTTLYELKKRMADEQIRYCDLDEDERSFFDKMDKYNPKLKCPMNQVSAMTFSVRVSSTHTIPIKEFFVQFPRVTAKEKSRKVEKLIEDYSIDLINYNKLQDSNDETSLLLRDDFDKMVEEIRRTYISKNYVNLMSWLINRAFVITRGAINNKKRANSKLGKNKSLLLKTLYSVNKEAFLMCFAGHCKP